MREWREARWQIRARGEASITRHGVHFGAISTIHAPIEWRTDYIFPLFSRLWHKPRATSSFAVLCLAAGIRNYKNYVNSMADKPFSDWVRA